MLTFNFQSVKFLFLSGADFYSSNFCQIQARFEIPLIQLISMRISVILVKELEKKNTTKYPIDGSHKQPNIPSMGHTRPLQIVKVDKPNKIYRQILNKKYSLILVTKVSKEARLRWLTTNRKILLPSLMKNQIHTSHLEETHMCYFIQSHLFSIWVCDSDYIPKIGKDAEKRVGISMFLFLVVRITKRKEAEFWRQCFWLAKLNAYGEEG